MTSNLICRVCLCTSKLLRELDDKLADHFADMCDFNSGVSKLMCCSVCVNALKSNLDFKNKCRKANQILQGWRKSQKKVSINSLYKLLGTSNDAIMQQEHAEQIHIKQEHVLKHVKQEHIEQENVEPEQVEQIHVKQEHVQKHVIQKDLVLKHVTQATKDHNYIVNVMDDSEDKIKQEKSYNNNVSDNSGNSKYEVNIIFDDDEEEENNTSIDNNSYNKVSSVAVKIEHEAMDEVYLDHEALNYDDNNPECVDNKPIHTDDILECIDKKLNDIPKNFHNKSVENKKNVETSDENIKQTGRPIRIVSDEPNRYSKYESLFTYRVFYSEKDVREEMEQRRLKHSNLSSRYSCELCYKVFINEPMLQYHMKWHDPARAFACPYCRMRFGSERMLYNHDSISHRGVFSCRTCEFYTCYLQMIMRHCKKHEPGKVYKCDCTPDMIFESRRKYLNHMRSEHAHVCVTCARAFTTEAGLIVHRRQMHQTKLLVDSETVSSTRCEPCGLTFTSEQIYNMHVLSTRSHKDIASSLIACSICGLSFKLRKQLKEHMKNKHSKICGRKSVKNKLKRSFVENKTYECKVCGVSFESPSQLVVHHRREHYGITYMPPLTKKHSYLCDQCGKGCLSNKHLLEHSRTHTGVRPFQCDKCPKSFRTQILLKYHSVWHSPPSRECTECGKKFCSKSGLLYHMRSHVGDRHYKCRTCGAGFLSPHSVQAHIRGVHMRLRQPRKPRSKQQSQDNKDSE